jgi:hypothetical protein
MLPSSWIDFNVSLKWKHRKSKELGHTPWLVALSGVEGVLELRDGTRMNDKQLLTHTNMHKTKQRVG